MVRTTSCLPRKHLHPPTLQQPHPLGLHVIRISRQAVCNIVDNYEYFQAINDLYISHGSSSHCRLPLVFPMLGRFLQV